MKVNDEFPMFDVPGTKARYTGEFRPPRRGELYLSGAIIEAYPATADISTAYHIAVPVPGRADILWVEGVTKPITGVWCPSGYPDLQIPVTILRGKSVYGRKRVLITPLGGAGDTWVDMIQIIGVAHPAGG